METNRFTFDKLHAAGSSFKLTPAMAIDLQDELSERKEALKTDTAVLQSLLDTQNHKKADEAYAIEKKDSGKITVALSPEFDLVLDRTKKVDWDQDMLSALASTIKDAGEDPAVYIITETELTVKEASYASWPEDVRAEFLPARTVKVGETKYTVQPKKKAKK